MGSVKPKKYLGQHFLTDQSAATKIVGGLSVSPDTELVEIGPGTGVLTDQLLKLPMKKFLAIDLDQESITFLKKKYPAQKEQFIFGDFLKEDLTEYFQGDFSVIGNFPYNISSQIFFKLLASKDRVAEIVCMLQKEVAERIAAKHGSKVYGILSVLMQAYFEVEYLFTVEPEAFYPPPKVRSGVIRFKRRTIPIADCDEKLLKTIVKTAFQMRRKTLRNALKGINLPTEITETPLFDLRAEQLSVQDFITLTKEVSSWNQ